VLSAEQKERLTDLFTREHVAVIITQGEQWPTGTLQAFGQTPELDLIFIMGDTSEKFLNLVKHPQVAVTVDTRDVGDVATFKITRALVRGVAEEVPREGPEWERLKELFLKKNPFEAPFFGSDKLRMVRVRPTRVSYAGEDRNMFKAEF
jgi:nitroimidazol reductase NimA-like FMN-containing flavoprotein (pyridoxamine 5'-phosphate oxidase superfamily)